MNDKAVRLDADTHHRLKMRAHAESVTAQTTVSMGDMIRILLDDTETAGGYGDESFDEITSHLGDLAEDA